MRTVDLILRKRGSEELSVEEIQYLVNGFTSGEIPDYQMAAFLMATYFSGMTDRELSALTEAMIASGETVLLNDIPGLEQPTFENLLVWIETGLKTRGFSPSRIEIERPTVRQRAVYTPGR